jgi:hypothetical protein
MKHSKSVVFLLFASLAIPVFATQPKSTEGPDLLVQLEADFAKAVAEHGRAAFVTYFADDGVELEDGGGIATRDAISKKPAWPEGTSLTWTPVKADMSASGDLGYTYETTTSSSPKTKKASRSPTTANTPQSGRSRKTACGR